MMKRAKGTTLGEIMKTTGWQAHTVLGFVSILGSKGGEKSNLQRTPPGSEATRSPSSLPRKAVRQNAAFGSEPGTALLLL
jgi:hypothetical protein